LSTLTIRLTGHRLPALLGVAAVNAAVVAATVRGVAPLVAAAALAAPAGLALVRRPQRGILALAALVPFDGLLLLADHPPLLAGWKEALLLATVAASLAAGRDAPPGRLPDWWLAVGGLAGLAALSALSVGGWQAAVGLKVLFFYVLVAAVVHRHPLNAAERDRLVTILLAAGVATAAVGLAQQGLGPARLHALGYQWNETIRTTHGFLRTFSTFNQPFGFAFFLVLVLLVGIAQAIEEPRRARSRVFLVALPGLVLALASTFVRGAWIGLVAGLAYLGVTRCRALLAGLPLLAVSVLVLPHQVVSAALAPGSGADRVGSWAANLSAIASHPFGTGVGASGSAAAKAALLEEGGETFQPDNFYYKVAFELGPLGLWLFVLLLFSAFCAAHAAAGRHPPGRDAGLARATAAMVLAAASASLVATYLEIFPMDVYFWLLLGVVSRCHPASS
jgi:hypothetical protein